MQTARKAFAGVVVGAVLAPTLGAGLLAQAPSAQVGAEAEPGLLVVLSGSASEALLLDPVANRVLARFPTGPDPQDVALSPDGRFAYITSYGWEPGLADAAPALGAGVAGSPALPVGSRGVTVLDLAARQVHAVFQPAEYRNLGGVTVGEEGNRLWITSAAEGGVVELDAHTGAVKMLWKTGGIALDGVTVSPDGRSIFVSDSRSDAVTVIDRLTVVPTRVPPGHRPTGLAMAPHRREVWVTNSGDNTISVIKGIRSPREIERFPSGGIEPVRVSFHAGRGEAWVSHRGSRTVAVLDIGSAAPLAEIALPGVPHEITFARDGRRAYVSSPTSRQIFAIDVASREVVESLSAGSGGGGIAWSHHGNP